MLICIEIGSFVIVFELWRSQVGNRRTAERMDRRTDAGTGREHYSSGQSRLAYIRIETVYVP